jgi:hypothetical protein
VHPRRLTSEAEASVQHDLFDRLQAGRLWQGKTQSWFCVARALLKLCGGVVDVEVCAPNPVAACLIGDRARE